MPSARGTAKRFIGFEGRSYHNSLLLRGRSGETPLHWWRRNLRYQQRWILYHERYVCHCWSSNFCDVYQTCGYETTGTAVESLALGHK